MSGAVPGEDSGGRGRQARKLIRHFGQGVLATQSAKLPGYPYPSALPFCTDQRGRVVVLISHLAEHTRNAAQDVRAGFLVSPAGPGFQDQARVSQVGDIAPIEDALAQARYLRFFPEARDFLAIGGFRFFRIEPKSLRLIAGFGSIHTVPGGSYLAAEHPIAGAEAGIIEHMNQDHTHTLRDYCRHLQGLAPDSVEMIGIDCDGFDVRADGAVLRFDFDTEVEDAGQARAALVELARVCRT